MGSRPVVHAKRRNVNGVAILLQVAERYGLTARRMLNGSGLGLRDVDDPTTSVSFAQEFHLIRNLQHHCRDVAALGVEVGSLYKITSLASIGFVLVSSPTLRAGIDLFLRYIDLNVSMARASREDDGPEPSITFADRDLPADVRDFVVERSIAAGVSVTSQILGRKAVPRRVLLRGLAPRTVGRYRRFLGVIPAFGADRNALAFKQSDIDASLELANPVALRMAEEYCALTLQAQRARSGLAGVVRDRIGRSPRSIPSVDVLASSLFMSERSLRRRLEDEGTTYQALCLEVRHVIAEQLLAVPDLTVKRIAERVGYSEPAAFSRSFTRWKGMSPSAYRALVLCGKGTTATRSRMAARFRVGDS